MQNKKTSSRFSSTSTSLYKLVEVAILQKQVCLKGKQACLRNCMTNGHGVSYDGEALGHCLSMHQGTRLHWQEGSMLASNNGQLITEK